jgi:hypothetical protein
MKGINPVSGLGIIYGADDCRLAFLRQDRAPNNEE